MNMALHDIIVSNTKNANEYLERVIKAIEEKDKELAEDIAYDIKQIKYYIHSTEHTTRYCAKLENGEEE